MLLAEAEQATAEVTTDAAAVAAAVAALGPLDHEALLLRVGGRSIDDIAAFTGTTPAMVRVRLHRAATAVERRVGQLPVDGVPVQHDPRRPTDEVVADAEVGITPTLHARLVAAIDHTRQVDRLRHRRAARLAQAAADHAHQLASLATVTGLALFAAMALATAA